MAGNTSLVSTRRQARKCGARLGEDAYCRLPAGHNTEHPGLGFCDRHGGNISEGHLTRKGLELVHGGAFDPDEAPAQYIKIDADEALQTSIWVAAGELAYWTGQIDKINRQILAELDQDEPHDKLVKELKKELKDAMTQRRLANADMRRSAGDAMKTNLVERTIKISERVGGLLADAMEVLVRELELTPKQEALVPIAMEKALTKIAERQPAPAVDLK